MDQDGSSTKHCQGVTKMAALCTPIKLSKSAGLHKFFKSMYSVPTSVCQISKKNKLNNYFLFLTNSNIFNITYILAIIQSKFRKS